jgi:hypothetical protein
MDMTYSVCVCMRACMCSGRGVKCSENFRCKSEVKRQLSELGINGQIILKLMSKIHGI